MSEHHDDFLARGPRVALRALTRADAAEFTRLVRVSEELHTPWLSMPATEDAFMAYMDRTDAVETARLLVCLPGADGAIAGFVNINNIVRGAFRSGYLGYGSFAPTAGHGYMTEGLGLVLRYAFGPLGLHRLEANIQPGNAASLALVKRLGFRLEGFSPDYLFISGAWRDHERWAITADMIDAAEA
ncbi:GNAT family N-acetyltransferase [Streptomyces sp. UNOC14_S4]|uniref:GNAT family N-acetyltransferase n=1 Tax=Streptomyces sp. UNOC14_S4 TaxID=2872340 RepID=UPI001E4D7D3E|nr:GNAT family protein [Streptomyces sp. UNOC14_S4]MCC3771483.1 GNAT family N-acetyltransferase [Streptomyces sp. UNOC14_S4]